MPQHLALVPPPGRGAGVGPPRLRATPAFALKTFKVALQIPAETLHTIYSSKSAACILRGIFQEVDADREHLVLLSLNARNAVLGFKVCTSGWFNGSSVSGHMVLRSALLLGGGAMIIAHNHPSGDPRPSDQDERITRAIVLGAESVALTVLDHVILGSGSHYSFCDEGKIADMRDRARALLAAHDAGGGLPRSLHTRPEKGAAINSHSRGGSRERGASHENNSGAQT